MHLSIVVPVFNSGGCLEELAARVERALGPRTRYELILVDDDSPDDSWEVIERLTSERDRLVGVRLRKNAGQDNAIMAGLRLSTGDIVVIMDDDLQHDPADIPALVEKLRRGFDVVYARFGAKRQAAWKNMGSWLADRAAVLILDKPPQIYMSPFKAVDRAVVDEIIKYEGPFSYVDGLIFTVTSNITQIEVAHHERYSGASNYTFVRSLAVWLKLATGFSPFPLRVAAVTGGIIALLSFAAATFFVVQALVLEQMPPGWPSLIVSVFFLGGIQLMGIGAVGEYIGRIFVTQNRRPQSTVKVVLRSRKNPDG